MRITIGTGARLGATGAVHGLMLKLPGRHVPGIHISRVKEGDDVVLVIGRDDKPAKNRITGEVISHTPLHDNATALGMKLSEITRKNPKKILDDQKSYGGAKNFVDWWNAQPAGSIDHVFVLAHNNKGVITLGNGATMTAGDLGAMRDDVMAPGGNFVWFDCFSGGDNSGSRGFVQASDFNRAGWTWGVVGKVKFVVHPQSAYAFPRGAGMNVPAWWVRPPASP